jgi:hypothetical protein
MTIRNARDVSGAIRDQVAKAAVEVTGQVFCQYGHHSVPKDKASKWTSGKLICEACRKVREGR